MNDELDTLVNSICTPTAPAKRENYFLKQSAADRTFDIDVTAMSKDKLGLFVAVPSYGGGIPPEAAMSLLRLQSEWTKIPLPFKIHLHTGNSLIGLARNLCVADFMLLKEYSHLLFIDSDIVFQPNEPLRMMAANLDILGGDYPKRFIYWDQVIAAAKRGEFVNLDTAGNLSTVQLLPNGQDLGYATEAHRLPGGFTMVKRSVFETLFKLHPELKFSAGTEKPNERYLYDLYESGMTPERLPNGELGYAGEDYRFCQHAINAGFKLWRDNIAQLGHIASTVLFGQR